MLLRFLPFLDLKDYQKSYLSADIVSALSVVLLAVPQGVAYAMIAGLPPAMGLYACGIPVIIGCLLRSSRHVITGPSNALSLLVAGALFSSGTGQPIEAAVTLAFMVGAFQLVFGILRLGGVVDYISQPVVLGYVVGAGVLIGVGQLPNATGVPSPPAGNLLQRLANWWSHVADVHVYTVLLAVLTIVLVLGLRRLSPKFPAGLVSVGLTGVGAWILGLSNQGVATISDLALVPTHVISFSAPSLGMMKEMLPYAIACTVLSSVESAAVGRAIASSTGQRLDSNTEFFGQGASNIAASFLSGYPISGSLGRSTLNARSGAKSRLSGVLSGAFIVLALPFMAPLVNHIPVGALAGLILVVAMDLIQIRRIRDVIAGPKADGLAMLVTMMGTWVLDLDTAIYVGVGISLVLFLRRVRLVQVSELVIAENGRFEESEVGDARYCSAIRILHVEGNLFFGAAGELRTALESARLEPELQVLIVRLKRTRGLDSTSAQVLIDVASRMHEAGQRLYLVGLRSHEMNWLRRSGALDTLGPENVFPRQKEWFAAMNAAIQAASLAVGQHQCNSCPIQQYISKGSQ